MKLSIYSSAYNLIKNGFKWQEALDNFSNFADTVTIAVNLHGQVDDTYLKLYEYCVKNRYLNVDILAQDIPFTDPLFDGKLKDYALQNIKGDIALGLDFDEAVPMRHKERWRGAARLLSNLNIDSFMIPMINLWGNEREVREDEFAKVKFKWYLHKKGLRRGVVNFAKLPNGKIDVDKSDTCELIKEDGNLASFVRFIEPIPNIKEFYDFLEKEGLFIYHTGYVDFENTVKKNNDFWQKHWELRSGKSYNKLPLSIEEMEKHKTIKHGLKLWNE